MKRKRLIISLGITIASLVIFFVLSMPAKPEPAASDKNTNLYNALLDFGITDAVVDITEERAFIRYNLPDFLDNETAVFYIMVAAASVAPEAQVIIVQTYQNFEPVDEVTVSTKDVISLREGKISEEEFLKKIS